MRSRVRPTDARPPQDLAKRNLPWLYAGRGLRSFVAAFVTVVFPLYLAASHDSAATVGLVLTVSSFIIATLILSVGLLVDRVGPRTMLLIVASLSVVGCGLLAVSPGIGIAMIASGIGSIGRGGGAGSGGAFGPLYPAEQPLLASSTQATNRTKAFGVLGAVGVAGGAVGSLVAWVPNVLHSSGLSLQSSYRMMFAVGAVLSLVLVAMCLPLREPPKAPRPARSGEGTTGAATAPSHLSVRQFIGRLTLTNSLNGLGFGFLGPLLVYWFHVRFGAGSGEMGTLYFVINLLTVVPYLGAAGVVRRLGKVEAVVASRLCGTAALVGMAFAGSFELAAALLTVRNLCNALSNPARQSFLMGAAAEERRGLLAAVSQLPSQVTSSVSPAVGGALMPLVEDFPIFGAAFFQALNAVTYYYAFRHVPEREEREQWDAVGDEALDPVEGLAPPRRATS